MYRFFSWLRQSPGLAGRRPWILAAGAAMACAAVLTSCSSDDTTAPPVLSLQPTQIELARDDTTGSFEIRNDGSGTLQWSLEVDAPWLVPDVVTGTTGKVSRVSFSIVADSLSKGPPMATVAVSSNGGQNHVHVHMRSGVQADPVLLDFGTSEVSLAFDLSNETADTLRWAATTDVEWAAVAPASGTLGETAVAITVAVEREQLGAGAHVGAIHIDTGGGEPDTIEITVAVPLTASGHVYFTATKIPVAGALVSIGEVETQSTEDGSYLLRGVSSGEHTLRATLEGFDPYEATVQIPDEGLARDIEMTSELHTHAVHGRVINSLGEGLRRAIVTLLNPDGSPTVFSVQTEDDGAYELTGVPEGSRSIRFWHPLYDAFDWSGDVPAGGLEIFPQLWATLLPPPDPETGPYLERFGCDGIRVSWDPMHEETLAGYRIERALGVAGPYSEVSGLVDGELNTYLDDELDLHIYYYRVKAENIDGLISEPTSASFLEMYPWILLNGALKDPFERYHHASVYDARNHRLIVFGGIGCDDYTCGVRFNDTWALDLTEYSWEGLDAGTGPREREGAAAIYDEARERLLVHAGLRNQFSAYADIWTFDLAGGGWTELQPNGAVPAPRYGHTAIHDPVGDRMIVYGGRGADGEVFGDLWAFDLATERWELLWERDPEGADPQPWGRYHHTAIYDGNRHRMLVHGGAPSSSVLEEDTWAFRLGDLVWEQLPNGPLMRYDHTAIYDPVTDRMVIFAGRGDDGSGETLWDDVWEYVPGSGQWSRVDSGVGAPRSRFGHSAIYDPVSHSMIVYAGDPTKSIRSRVWAYCWSH